MTGSKDIVVRLFISKIDPLMVARNLIDVGLVTSAKYEFPAVKPNMEPLPAPRL